MDILTAFVSGFSRFVSLPMTVLNLLLSNYFLVIFFGGLIFFVANTPPEALFRIYDAFAAGDFAGVITAIVDASVLFAHNVQNNFSPAALSAAVTNAVNRILGVFHSGNI